MHGNTKIKNPIYHFAYLSGCAEVSLVLTYLTICRKYILKKWGGIVGLDSSGSGQGPVIGYCEHSKEHFGSWKTGNFTCRLFIDLSRTLCSMSSLVSVGSKVFQCHIRPLWWEGNKERSVLSQQFQLNRDPAFVLITYLDALLLDDIVMTGQTTSNNSSKLYLRHFAYQRRYKIIYNLTNHHSSVIMQSSD